MGDLTTFTIYNDALDQIRKYPQQFVDNICKAAETGVGGELPIGCHVNAIRVQRTRHSSEHTVYVLSGNTVAELDTNSPETKRIMKDAPDYFKNMVEQMERTAAQLRQMYSSQEG